MSELVYELSAEERSDTGKGASRRLRRLNRIPAIIYGGTKAQKPLSITLNSDEVRKVTENEAFFSHVVTVNVGSKAQQALVVDVQRHPARGWITHMDFQRVSNTTMIHKKIPVHFINEESCPGVKAGGLVQHNLTEIEVSCKASDLPEYLEVDMAGLELGTVVHLSDLKVPANVTLVELSHGEDHDAPVCSIVMAKKATEDDISDDASGEDADKDAE